MGFDLGTFNSKGYFNCHKDQQSVSHTSVVIKVKY